jgi:hypothetical protein
MRHFWRAHRPARALEAAEDGVRVCDIKDGGPLLASARLAQVPPLALAAFLL